MTILYDLYDTNAVSKDVAKLFKYITGNAAYIDLLNSTAVSTTVLYNFRVSYYLCIGVGSAPLPAQLIYNVHLLKPRVCVCYSECAKDLLPQLCCTKHH